MEELFQQLQYAQQESSRLKDEAMHQQRSLSDLQQQISDLKHQQGSLQASLHAAEQKAAAAQKERETLDSRLQHESTAVEQSKVSKVSSLFSVNACFSWKHVCSGVPIPK